MNIIERNSLVERGFAGRIMAQKKKKSLLKRVMFWGATISAGAFLTAIITAFANDMIGGANLFEAFKIVMSVIWSWVKAIPRLILSVVKTWGFAWVFGLCVGIWVIPPILQFKQASDEGPRIRATKNEMNILAEMLDQMASWAEHGFCNSYNRVGALHDTTETQWYISKETGTELLMERLKELGIELPQQYQKLPRNSTMKDAAKHYSRISSLLRYGRLDKARLEYPLWDAILEDVK